MATTKCDIIRDVGNANICGLCTAISKSNPTPQGCTVNGVVPPAAACKAVSAANARMRLFATQYSPANLFEDSGAKAARLQAGKNYSAIIQDAETALNAAYPVAAPGATSITWPDLELCLWDPTGTKGGPNNNVYYNRDDLMFLGMAPPYPVGGGFAEDLLWPAGGPGSPAPVVIDYLINPDLFAILMFALLVIVFGVLILVAWKSAKNAPYIALKKKEAERQALEANDPYKGTEYEAYPDPYKKCRAYISKLEAMGYSDEALAGERQRCGMSPE